MKGLESQILRWYARHKRDLPWRRTHNPYRILVSEVMLQQTQVERVIPKYREFLRLFPSAKKLAQAKPADVIKAWAGLGYNRRALYLQRTAHAVVKEYKGKFPKDLQTLKTLPGVGDYTARAIQSFAYQIPTPMMDTNHRKFYARTYFEDRDVNDTLLLERAEKIVSKITKKDPTRAYDWNQALMDFMTAVSKNTDDALVQKYIAAFPQRKKTKKKKQKPFKETDRYIRGRIIDILRERQAVSSATLRKKFPDIESDRYKKIILKLEKDGLIQRNKNRILLPNT